MILEGRQELSFTLEVKILKIYFPLEFRVRELDLGLATQTTTQLPSFHMLAK